MNPILVPRTPKERATMPGDAAAIQEKATATRRHPPILIFPEGTTVNQRTLIAFQNGAFRAGESLRVCECAMHVYGCAVCRPWVPLPHVCCLVACCVLRGAVALLFA